MEYMNQSDKLETKFDKDVYLEEKTEVSYDDWSSKFGVYSVIAIIADIFILAIGYAVLDTYFDIVVVIFGMCALFLISALIFFAAYYLSGPY